jgi:hypothetical protein
LALGLALGCAQVFGIEEACQVGTEGCGVPVQAACPDPAAPECPPPATGCDTYCQAITTNSACSELPQYTSVDQCLRVCENIPTQGSAGDGVNNLACRLDIATRIAPESTDCVRAGPTGGDACGGPCESYCDFMERICPEYFDGFETTVEGLDADRAKCDQLCASLSGTTNTFNAGREGENDLAGAPSAQCRIWHLTVAATYPVSSALRLDHCGHAVGTLHCIRVPGDPAPLL